MASRVAKAKELQGYNPKPVWPVCGNCEKYLSVIIGPCGEEKNKKCQIGNFGILKTGTCNEHPMKKKKIVQGNK